MITTMANSSISNKSNQKKEQVAIPYKVLQSLISKKVTGTLTIQDPYEKLMNWLIYVQEGKIIFVSSTLGQKERLTYTLSQFFAQDEITFPEAINNDYEFICQLAQKHQLGQEKLRAILLFANRDALTSCLALPRAKVSFKRKIGIEPILYSFGIKTVVAPVKQNINSWVKIREQIHSPFTRPIVKKWASIQSELINDPTTMKQIEQFKSYLNEQCTIYEISGHLGLPTLNIAQILTPLVKKGFISDKPFNAQPVRKKPVVACIDDSQAIQRVVKMTLMAGGFEVVGITEPAKAISSFVRQKPDLILMDINMPGIDGYKLSYMIRQSALLKDIPILMLTGRDGVMDRVKAKMVGAAGYISKPFDPQELVQSIQNNIVV